MPEWASQLWREQGQLQSEFDGFVTAFKVARRKVRALSGFCRTRLVVGKN